MIGLATVVVLAALAIAGCGGDDGSGSAEEPATGGFGDPPAVAKGSLEPETEDALERLSAAATAGSLDHEALAATADSGDARLGWVVSDLLRFIQRPSDEEPLAAAFAELTGVEVSEAPEYAESPWLAITDRMIAWDLPAPPGYRELKAELYLTVEPAWRPFFADRDSAIDWRLISWGGVLIDDRPLGDEEPCPRGCIPALDDPALTAGEDGDWYPAERTVFGVEVGGEAVAFPKNIMEVHEMVNVTIGGRRLGIPYCTLCGSAQAYFLDTLPSRIEPPVLRTSGLLSRSNKVMYDLNTGSAFDTFTGRALSGPLQEEGVTLPQTSVVASTWRAWRRDHPETMIVAEDGGIGREYPLDPLGGRDDDGPIFPVGDVDPRLPVQAEVVGVIAPSGRPVAFPVADALTAIEAGERVALAGVEVAAEGDGLRARDRSGAELPAHQAFWFAWSQFNPGTALWERAN